MHSASNNRIQLSINRGWMSLGFIALAVLTSAMSGLLMPRLMQSFAGQELFLLLALVSFWLIFMLCCVAFDVAIFVAFCLFGLVRVEPAPADLLFMVLLPVGLVTGRLSLKSLADSSLIHLLIWVFLATHFISLGATHAADGFRYVLITTYLILFFYLVKLYATSFRTLRIIIIGYLVSALLSVALVFLGFLGIGTEAFIVYGTRAHGLFKDANVFGPFLIVMIIVLIDDLRHPRLIPGSHLLKVGGLVALVAGVFLSGSRAAWGNLALSLLVYLCLTIKTTPRADMISLVQSLRAHLLPIMVTIIVGTGACAVWFSQMGGYTFLQAFVEERAKVQIYDVTRFARQAEGINAGLTHLVGVGSGMWSNAHSLYVRTFAENGILGFAALFGCFFALGTQALHGILQANDKPLGLAATVPLACLIGHLLNGIVIDTIHWRHFWFILALTWVVVTPPLLDMPDTPRKIQEGYQ